MPQDILAYAVPFFVLLVLIELGVNFYHKLGLYEKKDTAASMAMGLGSLAIGLGVKFVAFLVFTWLHQYAIFDIGWAWWAWVLILFADDFTFYVHHRASHEVRLLWAAHVNHHSSRRMNLGTALRQSWGELLYKYAWWLWMPLIGFEPLMIMMMMSINLIYQFWVHTELINKMGPLEWIFNTPSHHRVHHASNIKYLDKNHAGIFIIWDRLFGSFVKEEGEKPIYGIRNNITTYNPLKIATHEYASLWNDVMSARSWHTRLKYLYMPPGWTPDGSGKTTRELQRQ